MQPLALARRYRKADWLSLKVPIGSRTCSLFPAKPWKGSICSMRRRSLPRKAHLERVRSRAKTKEALVATKWENAKVFLWHLLAVLGYHVEWRLSPAMLWVWRLGLLCSAATSTEACLRHGRDFVRVEMAFQGRVLSCFYVKYEVYRVC